jgi:predicted phosphoribosyltransferase
VISKLHLDEQAINAATQRESEELKRREARYRGERPAPTVAGRCVVLVDDGLATGSTMRAAIAALRRQGPASIVVAVPVGAGETCEELRALADDLVCVHIPESFYAVGIWYDDFAQTRDDEVRVLLQQSVGRLA